MKWALVLSGGGARGLAYIGMLKAFEELNFPKPSCIVGCSMGSIIGACYSLGKTPKEMEHFFINEFDINNCIGTNLHLGNLRIAKLIQVGTGLTNLFSSKGADTGAKIHSFFFDITKGASFSEVKIPFFCNATDICSGEEFVFSSGLLADALRATSSYPGFFMPFFFNETFYVDGCVLHNTPVWIAKKQGFKNILAVTLGSFKPYHPSEIDTTSTVLMRTLDCAINNKALRKIDYPTLSLDFTNTLFSSDFSDPAKQILFGYQQTLENKENLSLFFKKGFLGAFARKKLQKTEEKTFRL